MSLRVASESYEALQGVVGGCTGIVFGDDCYDTIVQGMSEIVPRERHSFLGGISMVEVELTRSQEWQPGLMPTPSEPLFMNN